jgi:hypothetical protein
MAGSRTKGRAGAAAPRARRRAPSPTVAWIPLVSRLRDRVSVELNARKDRASEVIQELAHTVRRTGEPFHDESLQALGTYADKAAARLDRLASDLRDRDVSELADDVRRLARQRPGIFVAAGFAAGLAAARFLRSTATDAGHGARRSMAADRSR